VVNSLTTHKSDDPNAVLSGVPRSEDPAYINAPEEPAFIIEPEFFADIVNTQKKLRGTREEPGQPVYIIVPGIFLKPQVRGPRRCRNTDALPDGQTLEGREFQADNVLGNILVSQDNFIQIYLDTPRANRKNMRIYIAKALFPFAEAMTTNAKFKAASAMKSLLSSVKESPDPHLVSCLMKAFVDRLELHAVEASDD
jgi:hypothetical protein